jgi:hypothetical protein
LVKDALKLRFQFPFDLLIVFYELASKRIFFFFEFFDSFIQNLDVKLELLLYLDMVSYLTLIVLKLSFILLGRQVHRLESRREPRVIQAFASKLVSHCAVGISTACIMPTLILIPIISFLLELHQDFNRRPNIIQDRQTIELQESFSLLFELVMSKSINFIIRPHLHLQVQINYCFM